jgi:hypothetical protein
MWRVGGQRRLGMRIIPPEQHHAEDWWCVDSSGRAFLGGDGMRSNRLVSAAKTRALDAFVDRCATGSSLLRGSTALVDS